MKDIEQRAWRAAARLIHNRPTLDVFFGKWLFKKRWRRELALLDEESVSPSSHPSIVHVGLNRSASQWIKSVLQRVVRNAGLVHIRWNEMAFDSEYPFLDHLDELGPYEKIFRPKGYLYSAFGGYPAGIPEIERYKVILVVRDPRDILVSRYFSKAVSHRAPLQSSNKRRRFMQSRRQAREQTVEEFVLGASNRLLDTYEGYLDGLLQDHPNVHIARYEDMTDNVEEWLNNLLSYIEISPPRRLVQQVLEEAYAAQSKNGEDVTAHVRKGQPGDYLEKLSLPAIEQLNDRFSSVLDKFDYRT